MVEGSGYDAAVLQKTINILDDQDIDFFIHWDLKFPIPKIISKYSKIVFIPRIKVYWGNESQIFATKLLLEAVNSSKRNYTYAHLISSNDMPLMKKKYFKNFFKRDLYLGFASNREVNRLSYYYPMTGFSMKHHQILIRFVKLVNALLFVNRLRDKPIHPERGCNWFSINTKFIPEILNYPYFNCFRHGYLADEQYLQTILYRYKPKVLTESDTAMAARYIDWQRGKPYEFTLKDVQELRDVVNTKYAFARKISDPRVIDKVFK